MAEFKGISKLVRDKIPEIIRAHGDNCQQHFADGEEYERLLRVKLQEEAEELAGADDTELLNELSDLDEVKLALMKLKNISPDELEAARLAKRETNGGFDQRTILDQW